MAAFILEIAGCVFAMALSALFGLRMARADNLKWFCPVPWRFLSVSGAAAALAYFAVSAVFTAKGL